MLHTRELERRGLLGLEQVDNSNHNNEQMKKSTGKTEFKDSNKTKVKDIPINNKVDNTNWKKNES